MASKEIVRKDISGLDLKAFPPALATSIDPYKWVDALVNGVKYEEPDPDYISRMLSLDTIFADTPAQVFRAADDLGLQKLLKPLPGEHTPPLMLTDIYVSGSDFEDGAPCFIIASNVNLETGEPYKFTTGATGIQATFIGLLRHGVWPIKYQIQRGTTKDKGGKYLLMMIPLE